MDLVKHASALYLFDYFGLIVGVSLLEAIVPRRPAGDWLKTRWFGNIGITVVDAIVIRSLFPVLTIGTAMLSAERNWGLLRRVHLPLWAEVVVALIVFDLIAYIQHYLFHRVR